MLALNSCKFNSKKVKRKRWAAIFLCPVLREMHRVGFFKFGSKETFCLGIFPSPTRERLAGSKFYRVRARFSIKRATENRNYFPFSVSGNPCLVRGAVLEKVVATEYCFVHDQRKARENDGPRYFHVLWSDKCIGLDFPSRDAEKLVSSEYFQLKQVGFWAGCMLRSRFV